MAAAKRRPGLPATLLLTVLVGVPLWAAPSIIRGLAAVRWVNHYGSMETLPRPRKATARTIVGKADLAISNLAPLPQASNAALLALEIGERLQYGDNDQEAALLIYQGIRASCARMRSRPLLGEGFAVLEARAAALEDSVTRSRE